MTTKRTPSDATKKSRAMAAYFKAEAAFEAAADRLLAAQKNHAKRRDALHEAQTACAELGCPLPEPQP